MFGWLRQLLAASKPNQVVAKQPPGHVFPWPKGTVLTAVDDVVFALPLAVFGDDEAIGSVLHGPKEMEINIPLEGNTFYIRLSSGMSVSLTKSCQACVVANDGRPRRIKVSMPATTAQS
ncbi:MAG TPA: hypothetical protein VH120_11240 [Gemmataceae bacterium]|nr:hypothetical protein [Gemmataceae bacterium]